MQTKKTCFDQVPLEAIKTIIEEDTRRRSQVEKPADSKTQGAKEDLLMAAAGALPGGTLDRSV